MNVSPPQPRRIAFLVAAIALFSLAMATREVFNPWLTNTVAAVFGAGFAIAALGDRLLPLLDFRPLSALLAAAIGVALVGATHVSYGLMIGVLPELELVVADLYAQINTGSGRAEVVPLIILVVIAEELIWRGLAVALVMRRKTAATFALAVGLYVIPQLAGMSIVLIGAALVLGAIMVVMRLAFCRLTEPIIAHAVWSTAIFGLVPL